MTYSHLLALGFTVESADANGDDITLAQVIDAVKARLLAIAVNDEWQEAVRPVLDSYEVESDAGLTAQRDAWGV